MTFLFICLSLIVLNALYNLFNFLRYPIIDKKLLYNYSSDSSKRMDSLSCKTQILSYIKNAGVKDRHIPVTQAVGYGHIASSTVSVLDNILNNRKDVASMAMECLLEAKGNYWFRFINSFNPFYWLKIILFIPKYTLSYLGLKEESVVIKIFQIIYWLACAICTFALAIFPEEIKKFIFSIFNIT